MVIADFEANNKVDNTYIGNKTTSIFKPNPVFNGYYIISELGDFSKGDHYESPSRYNNVDWFVNEAIKLENKLPFYFKNTKKDIIMTEEDGEHYIGTNFCRFCEKKFASDKVRDYCHSTGKYRGPAHNTCYIKVKEKQSNSVPFVFHNFCK